MSFDSQVIVITGAGGMGLACARRLGSGNTLLLADFSEETLKRSATELGDAGFTAHTHQVDVSSAESVDSLIARTAELGTFRTLVHTAGLSPTMADADRVLAVDLVGTALVLDGFEKLAGAGTVAIVIASMAGTLVPLPAETERMLATAPAAELPSTGEAANVSDPMTAYAYAKRGNQVRVVASAARWGAVGARVVSISPGIIATGMGHQELESEMTGDAMRWMITQTPLVRRGTAEDIASAVTWLAGPEASYITGTDLLIDGGVVASLLQPPLA